MDVSPTQEPRTFTPGHRCAYAVPRGLCDRTATHWLIYPSGRRDGRCDAHAARSLAYIKAENRRERIEEIAA